MFESEMKPIVNWWWRDSETPAQIASSFASRVQADGGVVEAQSCLESRLQVIKANGLWSKASAVWLPHGYKEGKLYAVKGGAGADLSFTRAGTRTRKGPTYVEQVPYNLAPQSESFNTTWTKNNSTINSDAAIAPDGTLTADKIVDNAVSARHEILYSGLSTIVGERYLYSFYAKSAGESRYVSMLGFGLGSANEVPIFNVDNGTVDVPATNTVFQSATITSVGNGWYKCSAVLLVGSAAGNPQINLTNNATDNTLAAQTYVGNGSGLYIWGAQVVALTSERDYFRTTDRFNVPALDYTGSTCPTLSLEPARTNLLLRSEELDNASWAKTDLSVVANSIASPDGLSTADTLVNDVNTASQITQNGTISANATTAFSVFAKRKSGSWILLQVSSGANLVRCWYNISTGTLGSAVNGGTGTGATGQIIDYGNGWYRLILIGAVNNSVTTVTTQIRMTNNDGTVATTAGIDNYFYGAQLEQAAYATSYIPTTTGTVSRIADGVTGLNITSLINQNEGTLFWEGYTFPDATSKRIFSISDNTTANRILISTTVGNAFQGAISGASSVGVNMSGGSIGSQTQKHKIAFTYTQTIAKLFIDGVKIGEDNTFTPATGLTHVKFADGNGSEPFVGNGNVWALLTSALSEAEAIAATT